MDATMCFEFYHVLADIRGIKLTNIRQPKLKGLSILMQL
jgi:hypothetical protein